MQRPTRIANALLAIPALYGLALAALAVWKQRTGAANAAANVAVQVAVGLGLAIAFLAARRLSLPAKAKLLALTLSTGLGLLVVECTLTYLQRPGAFTTQAGATAYRAAAAQKLGQKFDTRTKREVIAAMRSQGVDAVPAFHPEYFFLKATSLPLGDYDVIPLGGVANRPTVFCNESGEYLVFESDEHGFNNPKGLYAPGEVDAVVLGDSFAQGACVCSNVNLASCVREKHPHTLNLGNAGNGPLSALATLAEYGQPLRPKSVIWCYYEGNDLLDLSREKKSALLRYLKESGYAVDLMSRQAAIDRELTRIIEEERAKPATAADDGPVENQDALFTVSSILTLGRVRAGVGKLLRRGDPNAFPQGEEVSLLKEVLQAAKERTERGGGRLYFVYLPAYERYGRRGYPDQQYNRVKEVVAELGLPFVDVRQAFDRHGDALGLFPFRVWGHYTEEGYRLAAETILQAMDEPAKKAP
jgi:hypothetical protein